MSATPPEQLAPTVPVAKVNGWVTILGLLTFFAGAIVARLLKLPPGAEGDHELAADIGDLIKALGIVIASLGGPLPIPELLKKALGVGGAKTLTALLIGGVLAAGSLLPGCGTTEIAAERTLDFDWQVGPPCSIRVSADGQEVLHATGPDACEPPAEVCAEPVPEP